MNDVLPDHKAYYFEKIYGDEQAKKKFKKNIKNKKKKIFPTYRP